MAYQAFAVGLLSGRSRELNFPNYYFFADRRLIKHTIKTAHEKNLDNCELLCYRHDNCVSLNIKKDPDRATGQLECELNNSTHMEHDEHLTIDNAYLYRGAKNACGKISPCLNNGICQSGFTDKGYRCLCHPGFKGEHCDEAEPTTCKEFYDRNMLNGSQLVTLKVDSRLIPVYCHMEDFGCGNGGWTPVMKIDGEKPTFRYYSAYWEDTNEFNLAGGKTGFDSIETKLPTYWNTSFSKICLGMKIDEQRNFVVISKEATSMFSLIADRKHRNTSLGRNTWTTLIGSQASLQPNCNKEGFNAGCRGQKSRIGILGNNEDDCITCDSRIGFGTTLAYFVNTCGNVNRWKKNIKVIGYILVQ